jgi:hypothetical protein
MATVIATPAPAPSRVSHKEFEERIRNEALDLSRRRKAQAIMWMGTNRYIDAIPSTVEECTADWRHAKIVSFIPLLTSVQDADNFDVDCYAQFADIWLDDLKAFFAYHIWIDQCHGWTSEDESRRNYHQACDMLRDMLADPAAKQRGSGYRAPFEYLKKAYYDSDGELNPAAKVSLIAPKAERLCGEPKWDRAKVFVETFYKNIVDAIGGDSGAINRVLRAIQHGGSSPNEPDIVNALEALLVTLYVPDQEIKKAWFARGGVKKEETL